MRDAFSTQALRLLALCRFLLLLLVVVVPASGVSAQTSLTVGLYPYVPRLAQFEAAIQERWAQVEPGVSLTFVSEETWDGGYKKDPTGIDVFVFDAMFFEYFRSQNWLDALQPNEIANLTDFVDYAIDGVKVGSQYFAIPLLGCTNILFYQKDDAELQRATTLSEINGALSQCTYTSQIPPDRRGIMTDMASGTTNAALYLDAHHSMTGIYPMPLPQSKAEIDPAALENLRELLRMASFWNGTQDKRIFSERDLEPYERASWFSGGYGRALIGFTESMSAMSQATRDSIDFKVMPLSDRQSRPLFYADVIGVNGAIADKRTRDLAVKLANLIADSETVLASIGPDDSNPDPQYLMTTRPSVFEALGKDFPIYRKMYGLLTSSNPIMFGVSDQSRAWLNKMKDVIRSDVQAGYTCGCDRKSSQPIFNNADAQGKCPLTCADHGGWNGQWTNGPPAPGSVCGCNSCPLDMASDSEAPPY